MVWLISGHAPDIINTKYIKSFIVLKCKLNYVVKACKK